MTEKDIESYLCKRVKKLGGEPYKFVSPGHSGVPDRMLVFPGNLILFVELKAPGKKPTPLQLIQHRKLTDKGCTVYGCVDSKETVDQLLEQLFLGRV